MGRTLQDSLDELISLGKLNNNLAGRVLRKFDKAISIALEHKVRKRLTIKCNKLRTYRFCDNVWTLLLRDVEFRELQEVIRVDWVKIVACDGKSAAMAIEDMKNN